MGVGVSGGLCETAGRGIGGPEARVWGVGGLFQIDGSVRGGKAGVLNGAGSGEAILNADNILWGVWEIGGPCGFSIYKEG